MERQPRPDNAETILDGPQGGHRPAPVPERIGAYRVEGRLGSGGMGEVFLAWDETLKRRVAIKRLRRDIGLSSEQRERFRREAEMAARLSHPNVVQIHAVCEEDHAIVMEYVEGQTLAERLTAGRLETPEVLRLALEIAEGLSAAHEAWLVHRDLKAANVMITEAGHAKILDFGLARPVVRAPEDQGFTRQGIVLGTCHAMSPEQARGEEVDERSDLFSFGALVHEMLTGRPPFRGNDHIDSLRRVVTEEPVDVCKARPDLPPGAVKLLRRLLAKNRDDRPSSAREVIGILEHLRTAPSGPQSVAPEGSVSELATGGATVLELPEPFRGEAGSAWPRSWARRRLLLAGVVVVLVVAGATALLLTIRSTRPLRVAVKVSELSSEDEELTLAALTVRSAALDTLGSLEKITPINPDEVTRVDGAPVQIGQAVSAGEVLTVSLSRVEGTTMVTFQRINVRNGEVIGSPLPFQILVGRENQTTLAEAVNTRIEKLYSDHPRHLGKRAPEARAQDYTAFIIIQERVEKGQALPADLDRLEGILRSSPNFPGAPILAARIAHNLYLSRRERTDLKRASLFIRQAQNIAPEDPRTLRQAIQIALTRDFLGEAEALLEKLEELEPGDPEILPLRADLAEKRDNPDEAVSLLAEAVEQTPSWQNRYRLAFLEARRGRIEEAREQIDAILRQSPDNIWALEARAHLELEYGDDLSRAEEIYLSLRPSIGERALGNLATINVMRGNHAKAAEIYQEVLDAHPDSVYALYNLAEVETELGEERPAEAHYRQALDRLMKSEADAELPPASVLLKAQCLARLGRTEEAVAIAREELRKNPQDPGLLGQSTLIYSLAGERHLAVVQAKAALEKGYQPRHFTGSELQWLRDVEELRPWLQKTG